MAQTALLVDDEKALRAYLATILEHDGFQILEAADGMDALALLRRIGGAVDVLVTDVNMPRMTGIELVNAVKTEFPAIPVVIMSGLCPPDGLRSMVFLPKPFTPQAMRVALCAAIVAQDAAGYADYGAASGSRRAAAMPIRALLKRAAHAE